MLDDQGNPIFVDATGRPVELKKKPKVLEKMVEKEFLMKDGQKVEVLVDKHGKKYYLDASGKKVELT